MQQGARPGKGRTRYGKVGAAAHETAQLDIFEKAKLPIYSLGARAWFWDATPCLGPDTTNYNTNVSAAGGVVTTFGPSSHASSTW